MGLVFVLCEGPGVWSRDLTTETGGGCNPWDLIPRHPNHAPCVPDTLCFSPQLHVSVHLCVYYRSVMSDSVIPSTVAHQAPLSMEFSRQEYSTGQPFPSPELSKPGIEPRCPALPGRFFTIWATKEAHICPYSTPFLTLFMLSGRISCSSLQILSSPPHSCSHNLSSRLSLLTCTSLVPWGWQRGSREAWGGCLG